MKLRHLKPLALGSILIGAVLASGQLYLRRSEANGVIYTIGSSRLNKWALGVGKGNPIGVGKEQFIDVDGKTYNRNLITHYKSAYVGPFQITRLTKEYPNSDKWEVPVDLAQEQRKLRVPTLKVLNESLGEEVYDVLQQSQRLELISVQPRESIEEVKHSFHQHELVGRTIITEPKEKAELLASFYDGLVPYGKGLKYGCFEPRHGLRATHNGKTADLLICFSCHQFNTYLNGKAVKSYEFVTDAPRPTFDRNLKNADIPIAR